MLWRLKNDHYETAKGRYGISAPGESFSAPAGSSTAMVVPLSELSSTQTEPPWRLAISHTRESPSPAPPYSRLRHSGGISAQYLPALLPGGQVSQPRVRRRGTGTFSGVGDRRSPRRLRLGGGKLGQGHDHHGGAAGRGEKRVLRRGYPIIVLGGFMMIVFQPPQCYRSSSRSAPCRG